ncbi:nose resistant to fluoxetine protein 6-like [Rhipicephalus microplus]|uniref:nose resistant to fluoxetine protein 6-like n=1 Tax=Rhipicephalus microplus TaxID=6941 RepID=UPI003F6B8D78
MSDLGAYDECIETVVQDEYGATTVRGQYCDVHLSILDQEAYNQVTLQAIINFNKRMARFKSYLTDKNLPGIRLGVCVIDACREQDLANIGSVLAGSFMKVTVKDCVTNVYEGMSFVQACIIAFLVVLAAVIASGTIFELFAKNWDCERNKATFYKCVSAFSLVSNSNRILQIMEEDNPEKRRYRFAYGLRFLSMFWICLGHSYGMINENITRIFNAVYIFETWESPIISAAFMAVDTFFFMRQAVCLSDSQSIHTSLIGYLLYLTLSKQKGNRAIIAVVAIIRRFIR